MSGTSEVLPHSAISGFFLGNAALHAQLLIVLRILEKLRKNRRGELTASDLGAALNLPPTQVRTQLRRLEKAGLVCRQPQASDLWKAVRLIDTMTLGDVYDCLINALYDDKPLPREQAGDNMAADLLLMQATMTINQSIAQQLRLFDLGRIGVAESGFIISMKPREWQSEALFS